MTSKPKRPKRLAPAKPGTLGAAGRRLGDYLPSVSDLVAKRQRPK